MAKRKKNEAEPEAKPEVEPEAKPELEPEAKSEAVEPEVKPGLEPIVPPTTVVGEGGEKETKANGPRVIKRPNGTTEKHY